MAQAQAGALVQAAQGRGEISGGERVAGAGGFDDLDDERGFADGGAVRVQRGDLVLGVLDDDGRGGGERCPDGGVAAEAEGGFGLVGSEEEEEEEEVGGVGEFEEDGRVAVAPEGGPPVEVEADGAAGAGGGEQGPDQAEAAVGECRGDARQVQ